MKNITLKNIALNSLLASAACVAVISPANAAPNNTVTASSNTANAKQMPQHRDGMANYKSAMSQLNLTSAQQAQMTAMREVKKVEYTNNRAQNKVKREQMSAQTQALVNANTLDTAALNRLADQHAAQAKQRFIDRVQSQQAFAKILTAEQRTQLEQIKAQRMAEGSHKARGGYSRKGA